MDTTFDTFDDFEINSSEYIRDMSNTTLSHYAAEKACFKELLGEYATNLPVEKYYDPKGSLSDF